MAGGLARTLAGCGQEQQAAGGNMWYCSADAEGCMAAWLDVLQAASATYPIQLAVQAIVQDQAVCHANPVRLHWVPLACEQTHNTQETHYRGGQREQEAVCSCARNDWELELCRHSGATLRSAGGTPTAAGCCRMLCRQSCCSQLLEAHARIHHPAQGITLLAP